MGPCLDPGTSVDYASIIFKHSRLNFGVNYAGIKGTLNGNNRLVIATIGPQEYSPA